LEGEIKKKITLRKGQKKFKRMRTKLKKIIYYKLGLNDEIETNKTLIKGSRKKIENQKNK
jgi:hypothetical protein